MNSCIVSFPEEMGIKLGRFPCLASLLKTFLYVTCINLHLFKIISSSNVKGP